MSSVLTKFEQEFGLVVNEEGKIVTSSLKVAEYYGKDHADVLKKIRKFIDLIPELGDGNFSESYYLNDQNKRQPMYIMDRQGFSMLVNKFTGDEATLFTYKYTKAFEQMAEELENKRGQLLEIEGKLHVNGQLSLEDYNNIRFSEKRTLRTFAESNMSTIHQLVYDFNEYVKTLDTETRIARCKSAIKGIQRLHDQLASENPALNVGNCYNLVQVMDNIKRIHHITENKRNGGLKAAQTKEIKKLQQRIEELMPPSIEDYFCIPYHPFSENRQYKPLTENKWVKTPEYKQWCDYFPYYLMPSEEELGIDWNKPIKMYLAYDHIKKFDVSNFHKSAIDMIFKFYGQDDNIINEIQFVNKTNRYVNTYRDGKIYFLLRNE